MIQSDLSKNIIDKRLNTYIEFKPLHCESLKKEITSIITILTSENIPGDEKQFFRKLQKYEKEKEYNYTKGYRAIAALRLEILLPKKLKTAHDKKSFAKAYMTQLNPLRYKLPWIAYEISKGCGTYLVLLISEREYTNEMITSCYKRNYYAKNGSILHEKGSPRLDHHGKPIKELQIFSSKVRLFTLSKKKTFVKFIDDLKQKFLLVIEKIIGQVKEKYLMKKKNAKKKWHFYNRKCVMEINHTKQYIEFLCNKALSIERAKVCDNLYTDQQYRSFPVPYAKEIGSLFYKYQTRFDKKEFHDVNGLLREISYKHVALPDLQCNLQELIKEANHEIVQLIPEMNRYTQ